MNRLFFLTSGILACAAAAWLGWRIAQPTMVMETSPVVAKPAVPAAQMGPRPDYSSAADAAFDPRKDRPLNDILGSIDRLRLDPASQTAPDDGISGELLALLYSLQPDEIPGVLQHLQSLPPPSPDKLLRGVLGRWAQFDGAAAMKWALQLTPSRHDSMRGDILSGWARSDPAAAWAWYQAAWDNAPEPRYRLEQNFPGLIHAWAMHDAPAALAACLAGGKHGTFNAWIGFGSLAALPEKRDEVMRLIAGIDDAKIRADAQRGALQAWSASAPIDAAAWLDANRPEADHNLVWCVAERYGRAHPKANADWLLKRTPPDERDEAYRMCLYQWAEVAPDDAAAWLETAGVTDMSAEAMAGRYARSDVDRAISWAQRTSPDKRAQAIINTLAQAQSAGKKLELSKYAAAAGVSAEELGGLVEKAVQVSGSRF